MRDGYGGTSQDAAARIRLQREAERRRIHELKNRFPYAGTSEGLHQQEEDYEEEEYGEYEEEPSEPEEEEEREPPKPTREEQEFLKLREKLKDRIRQKLKKQSASALGHSSQSQDKKRTTSNDKFGSFFGPSQPIIAPRVIEESRLIRENKHIVAKVSSSGNKRDPTSSEVRTHVHHQKARVVNEVKKKAQALKDMRDYSFLLSDDADLPSEKEQPLTRNVSAPKADGRSAQTPLKSRIPTSKPVKPTLNGHELKKPTSAIRPMQTKVSSVKEAPVNRSKSASVEPRKMLGGGARNGTVQTTGNKALPSKVPAQITSMNKPAGKAISDPGLKKNPSSAKPHSSAQHYHPDQKRVTQVPHRVKTTPKQPLPSSKAQPSKQIPSRDIHDDRSKKRPVRRHLDEEEDDVDDVRGLIRKMFRYDPSKYAGQDEDVSDMEVGFDVIQKEELRSSQIARREDEEQLRLIEQEEEEERRRKLMGKKQRLRH